MNVSHEGAKANNTKYDKTKKKKKHVLKEQN